MPMNVRALVNGKFMDVNMDTTLMGIGAEVKDDSTGKNLEIVSLVRFEDRVYAKLNPKEEPK